MSMYEFPDENCVGNSEWQSLRVNATALYMISHLQTRRHASNDDKFTAEKDHEGKERLLKGVTSKMW